MVEPDAPRLRAVVCDDDPMLRKVIRGVAAHAGVEVVAEADSPSQAIDMVQRYGADELILDLSLLGGRGEEALDLVRQRGLRCRTVVFSAYGTDADSLLAAGAAAVIHKPDFDGLEHVLAEHARAQAPAGDERRRARPPRTFPPPPRFLSPSGVVTPADLWDMLDALGPGDAVMSIRIEGMTAISHQHGSLVAADHLLHVARLLHETLRVQDRVMAGEDGSLVVTLVDGFPEAPLAVFRRLESAWQASGALGRLRAGYAICSEGRSCRASLTDAVGAVANATNDRPIQGA